MTKLFKYLYVKCQKVLFGGNSIETFALILTQFQIKLQKFKIDQRITLDALET